MLFVVLFSSFRPVLFSFPLGHQAIQSLVLGHPGSTGHGLHLMEGILSQITCWLVTPTSFGHHCPSTSCRQDTIVDQKVCGGLGVYVSLLREFRVHFCAKDAKTQRQRLLCRHQLNFSMCNELCRCCLQKWRLAMFVENNQQS